MARIGALIIVLVFAACGSDRYAAERGQVERLIPREVSCGFRHYESEGGNLGVLGIERLLDRPMT